VPPSIPPPKLHPISWLFIDVGGVLLDDAPLLDELYRFIVEALITHGKPVTLPEVLAQRERMIHSGAASVYKSVLRHFAPDDTLFDQILGDFRRWLEPRQKELNPMFPGVPDALAKLSAEYNLALAANQGAYIHQILEELNIRRYFSSAFLSGEMGLTKPEELFFIKMLESTGCAVEEGVMIGDNLVNDLRPANRLGMRTVRVRAGADNVQDDGAYTFVTGTVSSMAELPDLFRSWRSVN